MLAVHAFGRLGPTKSSAAPIHYDDENGTAVAVKRTVTFTEKTKFIYAINKGISGAELSRNPYRVNDYMASELIGGFHSGI